MLSQLANVLVVLATLAMGISNAAPSAPTASDKLPSNQPLILALPVGQGDSTLVVCPETDGRVVMVDTGSRQRGWSAMDVATFLHGSTLNGKRTLMERLTTIILTHPDADHYNYVPTVFPAQKEADFRANLLKTNFTLPASVMSPSQESQPRWKDRRDLTVYLSGNASMYSAKGTEMTEWLAGVKTEQFNNGAECFMEECYKGNSFKDQLCGPPDSVRFQVLAANMGSNKNEQSVVLRLSYNGTSALLVGDFEGPKTQTRLVQKVKQSKTGSLRADIYKISHHGAASKANQQDFLEAILPKMAFVSSAHPTKQYGHPKCTVLTSLQKLDSLSPAVQGKHDLDCSVKKGSRRRIEHLQPAEAIYATAPNSKEICMIVTALTGGGKTAASPPVWLFCWLFNHHKGEAVTQSAFDLRQEQVATQQRNALVENQMNRHAIHQEL